MNLLAWAWAIAAVVVGTVELHAPGSYLIWIACAAAITACVNFIANVPIPIQFLIFGISCVLTCFSGHFVYKKMLPSEHERELNLLDSEIGSIGTVLEAFKNKNGKIQLRDSVWLASGAEDFEKNTAVVVTGSRGTVLLVDRYER